MSQLNLRKSIVAEFWKSRDPRMAMILQWMESMEDWSMDDDRGFSEALLQLTPKMETSSRNALVENTELLLQVMAYMSSGRSLRLLEWFDEHFPQGLSVELVEMARDQEDDPRAQILIDRLRSLQSLSLLGRVFSPARVRRISMLLADGGQDGQPADGRERL